MSFFTFLNNASVFGSLPGWKKGPIAGANREMERLESLMARTSSVHVRPLKILRADAKSAASSADLAPVYELA
jgi:hypothetical protein